MGEEELGYVAMNIFDSLMSDQEHYDSGAFDDWFYQSQGVPAYTMEFWDVASKAGVPHIWNGKPEDPAIMFKRFNAALAWVKEHAPQYYSPWKVFNHPTGAFYGDITTYANAKAKKKVSWIVKAEEGSTVTVTCKQEKAGTDTKTITL